ncbi:MAG: ATP synthase F1 subunit gamma [Defluviitaleaceae bacterium]|nr:ATP synthase F1 subunit gamma [Defluviitaleaceae bacterium]
MPTTRDIKGRIRSVTTTKKTTKAMNLVSSAKMARARGRLNAANPYFTLTKKTIGDIINGCKETISPEDFPFFEGNRPLKNALVVTIANDRGLCGGYNVNVTKLAARLAVDLTNQGKTVNFLTIGNKARDFLRRGGANIIKHFGGISESPTVLDAQDIIKELVHMYEQEIVDEIHVVYTEFVSAITYVPTSVRMLPLSADDFPPELSAKTGMIKFEPSSAEVLTRVIPKYLSTTMYETLITSAASGQGATMTAMDAATENAENIISNLTLVLNRVRQAAITQEISEIVGGANALE